MFFFLFVSRFVHILVEKKTLWQKLQNTLQILYLCPKLRISTFYLLRGGVQQFRDVRLLLSHFGKCHVR